MKFLNESKSVKTFKDNRQVEFKFFLKKAYDNLSPADQLAFIENLDKLIGHKLLDEIRPTFEETALDAGLIYKDQVSGEFKVLSAVARDTLLPFLLKNISSVVKPVSFYVRSYC